MANFGGGGGGGGHSNPPTQRRAAEADFGYDVDDDDSDDSSLSQSAPADRIRRNYLHHHHHRHTGADGAGHPSGASAGNDAAHVGGGQRPFGVAPETIRVTLNEGFLAGERRAARNFLANCRQKVSSMQMFNPAKNQVAREEQEQWNEKEKYTLDCLNEFRGTLDEKFQWSRPEDGREIWSSKMQYFLAIISYSIGLGNVIRFPILVQKNGGLAFIIPFVIMLIVEGIPLFYLELAVGQRMRKAAISCWNLVSPFAAGIGIASAAVSFVIGLYYNTMVAWTLLYLYASAVERPLPYAQCPVGKAMGPQTRPATARNESNGNEQIECQTIGSFQYYWFKETLNISEDVNKWQDFNWPIFLCLAIAWLISYACLAKGLSSSKRVVYVASTFPYVILTIFFFKAISLDGMSDGIYYLFQPEVFFSLGLGFGGLIALSSYNPVNNNCYKDAIKVSLINFFTSIYAGIVIFAILGFKANLDHEKCLVQRNQMIDYYISDYNLKAMDYGSAFKPAAAGANSPPASYDKNSTDEQVIEPEEDYYDLGDATASIKNLDRMLDLSMDKEARDYGDSDTEFVIDVGSLISKNDMAKIIEDIPNLPTCSVQKELDQSTQGTGLVFVVMAQAISQFKDAPTWAIIFFLMLLTLGLDSQFGNLEGLLSSMTDLNFANSIKRQWITGVICGLSLVLSVIFFAHGAGSYMFAIFDEYAGSFSLVLIAIFELIAISYIYGLKKFCDDCELMTGRRPPFLILLSWRYISPILLLVVTFATVREFSTELTYEAWVDGELETKAWPSWCIAMGTTLIVVCVIWIPAIAILKILRINLIPEENLSRCWFPADELREFHDIQEEHKVTKMERILFGFTDED